MLQHTEPKLNGITEIYILKMHLCVERLLSEILQKSPNVSKKTLRSNFAAKRDEVEKLFDSDVYGGLFSKVYTLNRLRNEIAHNLESKKYQLLLQKFDERIEVQSGYELTDD
ncbi:hypothetical protein M2H12_21140, partial [Vibrio vulnificus]|nr:hypothetical protein [Vibrio vulnificus]MCU8172754.1 hypothetical protein [Vibrio vulnificus]